MRGNQVTEYKLNFGSYRGLTIAQVWKTDRQYVMWLRDSVSGPAQKAAQEFISAENRRIIAEGQKKP